MFGVLGDFGDEGGFAGSDGRRGRIVLEVFEFLLGFVE